MIAAEKNRREALEDKLAAPMFALALLFLALLAAAIYYTRSPGGRTWQDPGPRLVVAGLLVLWPIFIIESILRFLLAPAEHRTRRLFATTLLVGLLPPLRMGAYGRTRPDHMWLPWIGWQKTDFDLNKTLERTFSGPMVFMALMILPILVVEYFWSEAIQQYAALRIFLGIAVGIIWIAFTTEFVIRCSAAEKKFTYAFNHWVDLAVVLLPMLEFLPFLRMLRITRVMRLDYLARLAKYYRLYGLAGRGWRGFLVLEIVQRLFSRAPNARLSRLKSRLEDTNARMRELQREADYYRRKIEEAERQKERRDQNAKT